MRTGGLLVFLAACGGTAVAPTPKPAPKPAPAPVIPHAQGNPSPTVPDRIQFFHDPVNTQVRISPDGKRVAWIVPRNNVPLPVFAPVDDLKSTTPVATDTTHAVTGVFWTPDSTHLVYLQDQGDGSSHVFRYDFATNKSSDLVPIRGARVDLIGMSVRKPNVVIVGINDRDPAVDDIYSVDLTSGDKKRIVLNTDGIVQFGLDNDLTIRIGTKFLPDGTEQLLAYGPKGFELWDSIGADDRDTTKFLGIDNKGTTGWMLDSRGRDTAAVFAVDLKTKAKKLISEDPKVDATSAFVNPTTFEMAAVGYNYLRPQWKVVDKSLAADIAALDGMNAGNWELTSATKDGHYWLVGFASDIQPGSFYLYDHKTHTAKLLMTMTPSLDGMSLSRTRPVAVTARDGLELVAFVTIAHEHDKDGVPDHPLPTVILVGPDPTQHLTWAYDQLHQWLASRGYAVLTTNTRAAAGFGKKRYADNQRQWGRKLQDDLADVAKWAIDNKIADPAKIGIAGISYGGYAAVMGLETSPDLYACGVDILGPTDLERYGRALSQPYAGLFATRIGQDPAALREISPITHASAITKPLLIVHTADRMLGADKLADALAARKAPVSYVEFPDEKDPNIAKADNNLAMLAILEAYLSEQLGGYFEPMTPEIRRATSLEPRVGSERIPGL